MRVIKFRGWDGTKMTERALGADIRPAALEFGINFPASYSPFFSTNVMIALMQFTGILDKHGKEIYEGDILFNSSWWWGPRYVYLHCGECPPCRADSVMQYLLAKNIDDPLKGATYNLWNGCEVEVIGNIYQNAELLETP